jgi:hypothetical protein
VNSIQSWNENSLRESERSLQKVAPPSPLICKRGQRNVKKEVTSDEGRDTEADMREVVVMVAKYVGVGVKRSDKRQRQVMLIPVSRYVHGRGLENVHVRTCTQAGDGLKRWP